jgi:hypothetical protein
MFTFFRSIPRTLHLFSACCILVLTSLAGCVGAPAASGPPSPYGYTCYAGFYTCRLGAQYPTGTPCQCPGIGAPSYGTVR